MSDAKKKGKAPAGVSLAANRRSPRKAVKTKADVHDATLDELPPRKKNKWTKEETQRFIQAVEAKGMLYDYTRKDYKDNVAKANARADIGKAFNCTPEDVRVKWKSLTDSYKRERKIVNKPEKTGTGAEGSKRERKPWMFYVDMTFLTRFSEEAERTTNLSSDEGEELKSPSPTRSLSPASKKDLFENGIFYDRIDGDDSSLDDSSVLEDLKAKEDDGEISVDKPAEEVDLSFDGATPSCSSKQDFPEFKSPSQQSQFSVTSKRGKKKTTGVEVEKQVGDMMVTLNNLVATKPEMKKPNDRVLTDVQEDWVTYCKNFGMRVAAIADEEARDSIRMEMEKLYFEYKRKK